MDPTYFATAADFRAWLAGNAARADALLVGFHKVGSGLPSLSWPESVDEALCVGWIDGVRRRIDAQRYQIRFTPRRAGSHWSAKNMARVPQLIGLGRMQPAGLAAFAQRSEARSARASYEQPTMPVLPAEAEVLFRSHAAAWRWFNQQPAGYRQRMLWWVVNAKRAVTQASRLGRLIEACAAGCRL